MAGRPHDHVHAQVRRLFNVGAVGTMSDAQLLDRFVSRRDEAAEAAFEELLIRHGPMVFRVCRSVLHDAHDAEDAFQAVFLVLANRAGSIRRSGSVASWLFGVAERVSKRGKRSAARRQTLNELVAERTSESYLPAESDADAEILHEEINGLPERLRALLVLCCLQGLTYAAAARELGLSEIAIRGRLDRARERLRQRLTRRGVPVPAGFLVASAAGHLQSTIPMTLVEGTARIALGFTAGNTSAILARGVLNSMLLDQLRVAAALLCLVIGGSYWAWQTLAAAVDGKGRAQVGPAVAMPQDSVRPPRTDRYGDPLPPGAAMRLGTVRFRHTPSVNNMVYSPDGRFVVTDNRQSPLQVWDASNGKRLHQVDVGIEEVRGLAFSPDGTSIAVVGYRPETEQNRMVHLLTFTDLATGRRIRQAEWDERYEVGVAYAPDGKTIATLSEDGNFRLWDVATATVLHQERLGERNSRSIAFSPNVTDHLVAIAGERAILLWDAAHLRLARNIAVDGSRQPTSLAFSRDGTTLAAGLLGAATEIRLWRVSDGTLLRRFTRRQAKEVVNAGLEVAFSPDGKVLAGSGWGRRLVLFDVATGRELDSLSSVRLAYAPLAFSPDGKTLATTGDRQTLHFWDLATGKDRLATPEAHEGGVQALVVPADGKTLVSGSDDRTVRTWDMATGRPENCFPLDGWVRSLSVSADGSLLAAATTYPEQAKVHVWNLKTGEQLHTWSGATANFSFPRGVTLDADGSSVIAAMSDGTIRSWDVSTGKERPIPQPKLEKIPGIGPGGGSALECVVFARDGKSAAFIGDQWVQVVDLVSGERRFKAPKALVPIRACEFAPDGGSLVVVRVDGIKKQRVDHSSGSSTPITKVVWLDSRTGHVRREIEVPDSYVRSLAFSPDGLAVAVGTLLTNPARGIIRIFRLQDKKEIQTIESPCPWIEALCYTPDGRRIVAGMSDTSIVIWDARATDYRR